MSKYKCFDNQTRSSQIDSRSYKVFISLVIIFIVAIQIHIQGCRKVTKPEPTILDKILQQGEITMITQNNANCYYLYRDEPMGFEYDLARSFARYLGVRLNTYIVDKLDIMIPTLLKQKNAFIASNFIITPKRQEKVAFSIGYLETFQHIIVHRKNRYIKTIDDLEGQTIHVRRNTSYQDRLMALKKEGKHFNLAIENDTPTEVLIQEVAEGKIDVTIAHRNIALLNRQYYPQIVISGPITDTQYIGWAVCPKARELRKKINQFFLTIKENGEFDNIYNRYYSNMDLFDYVDLSRYHRRLKTRLPKYMNIIQKSAEENGFDWRLIAAQIYQESHFNPRAHSHSRAVGLMQLIPTTARSLGVKDVYDSHQNINAGVRYLKKLYDLYDSASEQDRLFIALAAYNIGIGHLQDARALARKMNLDPNKWASLKTVLPLLMYHKYYKESRFGYCRGTEPLRYVEQIMIYYNILKRKGIEYEVSSG